MQLREANPTGRRRGEAGYRGNQKLDDCLVLCAQPDAALRRVLLVALQGARVVLTSTGLESLGALDDASFNVYVLDYWLPDWSGVGLCRHIRKRDRLAPICFYTNAHGAVRASRAGNCGADLYLELTSDACTLRRQLEDALNFRLLRLAASAR